MFLKAARMLVTLTFYVFIISCVGSVVSPFHNDSGSHNSCGLALSERDNWPFCELSELAVLYIYILCRNGIKA